MGGGSQRTRHSESWGPQYLSREREREIERERERERERSLLEAGVGTGVESWGPQHLSRERSGANSALDGSRSSLTW